MRCQVHLVFYKSYLPDEPLWPGTQTWNPWFYVYLILSGHQGFCNSNKIYWTIWLLYCDQLCLHLLLSKCFYLVLWHYVTYWPLIGQLVCGFKRGCAAVSSGKQGTVGMPSELCRKNAWASKKYITMEIFNPEDSVVSLQWEQSVSSQQSHTVLDTNLEWGWWPLGL